jgi:hypothetical protein
MALLLGENCNKCACATCQYLPECGTMCGNTKWYCENECKGVVGWMGGCSQRSKESN